MKKRELIVSNWMDFTGVVQDYTEPGAQEEYAFRGQGDAAWPLQPGLHRSITDDGRLPLPIAAELLEIEQFITREFRSWAPIQLPTAVLMSTTTHDIDWWPVMRHYGAPTRLLDWTSSPYVAAYFACRECSDVAGAVYLFHMPILHEQMKNAYGSAADISKARLFEPDAPPVWYTVTRQQALPRRLLLQQGLFTLCQNVGYDLEKLFQERMAAAATEVPDVKKFAKVIIPAEQKPLFMRHLRTINVTAATLFPDLDGTGKAIDEVVRTLSSPALRGLDGRK